MERINQIMAHPLFVSSQKRIEELEVDREFCTHGLGHSLDVARILYIKTLELQYPIPKDILYAVALLHDIGRVAEYETKESHHEAGARLSRTILEDCGYTREECERIVEAIASHKEPHRDDILCKLLFEADKLSRNCFQCKAAAQCYWPETRKNREINY